MDLITVFIIATGLSFDSFAVSLSCGVVESRISFWRAVRFTIILALFQGGFTVIGFYLGYFISGYLESFDHWVAFALLGFLGIRMIAESGSSGTDSKKKDILRNSVVITLAIGTSIDALAVGISFAFLYESIWLEALIIGTVTFIASMTAVRIGKSAGPRLGSRVERIGGLLLIAIGIKILLEHTLLA